MRSLVLAFLIILLTSPLQVNSVNEWWNPSWRFRISVKVDKPGSYWFILKGLEEKLYLNETVNPTTFRMVSPSGKLIDLKLQYANKMALGGWEGNEAVYRSNGLFSFLTFGPDSWVGTTVRGSDLSKFDGLIIAGSGSFNVEVKDVVFPNYLGRGSLNSSELATLYIPLKEADDSRSYRIQFTGKGEIKGAWLVGGELRVGFRADEAGTYWLYFDTRGEGLLWPLTEVEGIEVAPSEPEGFHMIPEMGRQFDKVAELKVKVLGNLTPVKVFYRLDHGEEKLMAPSGDYWTSKIDVRREAWDGRHVITFRAVEVSGRDVTTSVVVKFMAYRNGTSVEPGRNSFRFVVFGDNRPSGGAKQPEIFKQILEHALSQNPDLIFDTGDVVYSGEWKEYQEFVRVISEVERPFFIAKGNHEVHIGKKGYENFREFFGKDYYSFNFGNSHFVILDANQLGYKYRMPPEEVNWLEKDLKANDREHTFVFIHQPIYKYYHGLEDPDLEKRLKSILEKAGVDCVFQGHEHMLYYGEENGVRFFITGGGGAELDGQYPSENLAFHYVVVDVNGSEVSYRVVRPPVLEVFEDEYSDSEVYEVMGRTQPYAKVRVNGKEVQVTKTGTFTYETKLSPGVNEIVVEAEMNGTSLRKVVKVRYTPKVKASLDKDRYSPGDVVTVTLSCGPSRSGVVRVGELVLSTENGTVRFRAPNEGTPILVASQGCRPVYLELKVSQEFPAHLLAIALIVLALMLVWWRWGKGK